MEIPQEVLRHFKIHREIDEQSDRAAALIAVAYLDERLGEAIRAMLRDDIGQARDGSETIETRLFEGTGPLATLSGKVNIAFALGLFGPESLRDLHLIRKIRNHFAHAAEPCGFGEAPVSDWCRELRLPDWCLMFGETVPPKEARSRFLRSVNLIWNFLWTEMCKKGLVGDGRVAPTPTTLI